MLRNFTIYFITFGFIHAMAEDSTCAGEQVDPDGSCQGASWMQKGASVDRLVEVGGDGRKIFVGDLPPDATEESLKARLEQAYGQVEEIKLPTKAAGFGKPSGKPLPLKGFGWVTFKDERDADDAAFDGKLTYNGKTINIRPDKRGGDSRGGDYDRDRRGRRDDDSRGRERSRSRDDDDRRERSRSYDGGRGGDYDRDRRGRRDDDSRSRERSRSRDGRW